jgi:hypothetical protein
VTGLLDRLVNIVTTTPPPTAADPYDWVPPELALSASMPPTLSAAIVPTTPKVNTPGGKLASLPPLAQEWQERAWDYYDTCGEARQAVDWLAHGVSRCSLYIGRLDSANEGDPTPVDEPGVAGDVLSELYSGPIGQAAMLERLAQHLLVPGESWIVGYPRPKRPGEDDTPTSGDAEAGGKTDWTVLSRVEWQEHGEKQLRLKLPHHPGIGVDGWVSFDLDDVVLVPMYQPHPRDATKPTSAFQAALSTLDELDGLSKRVDADIKSRLVGAGALPIPESAMMLTPVGGGGLNNGTNPFIHAFAVAAQHAIERPDEPSAHLPVMFTVPDETIGKFGLINFATDFDAQIPTLRQDARKALAAHLDIPSSILLGIEDLNHWSTWSVQDDAIRAHIGPLISRICAGLTIDILWPALRSAKVTDAEDWCIWWSAQAITKRPDRSQVTLAAHRQRLIGGKAGRRELGYDETDAPTAEELAAPAPGSAPAEQGEPGGQADPGDTPNPPEKPEDNEAAATAA